MDWNPRRKPLKLAAAAIKSKDVIQTRTRECQMVKVVYEVVEHDGGWAYKFNNVFSETFPTHAAAHEAASRAAAEQRVPGRTEVIQFEDSQGNWREETVRGNDRPSTEVVDKKTP